jgi:formylglycine-generating enzyme required for sulfatase activity
MPKKERPDPQSEAIDVSVRLKPILGVRPGVYLTGIYGVALLLLGFFLLFNPGLRNRGSYLGLTTFPDHATVKIDGVYAGSTPCNVFIPRGERAVTVSKPYYQAATIQMKVRGRVFGTLLVPDRKKTALVLKVDDPEGLLEWALRDFQKNPEIAQIISDASWVANDPMATKEVYAFLLNCMYFVRNEAQVRELLVAIFRTTSYGTFLSPNALVSLAGHAIQLKEKYDNSPSWLLLALSKKNSEKIASSQWVQQYLSAYRQSVSRFYEPPSISPNPSLGASLSVNGMTFRSIPAGELVMGKDDNLDSLGKSIDLLLAHPVTIDPFYFGVTEVTNRQYKSFVDENPEWSPANRDTLAGKGLATDTYLAEWQNGSYPSGRDAWPVVSVSWNAATAYAGWFTSKVQAAMPGYQARLPLESEWEWAARGGLRGLPYPLGGKPGDAVFYQRGIAGPSPAGTSQPNGYGLRDMLGNVWEWCSSPFSPASNLLTSFDPRANAALERALPDAPDRAVRGGSWANQPGTDKVFTRGSQPTDWCTPYLGFRVALTRR